MSNRAHNLLDLLVCFEARQYNPEAYPKMDQSID